MITKLPEPQVPGYLRSLRDREEPKVICQHVEEDLLDMMYQRDPGGRFKWAIADLTKKCGYLVVMCPDCLYSLPQKGGMCREVDGLCGWFVMEPRPN